MATTRPIKLSVSAAAEFPETKKSVLTVDVDARVEARTTASPDYTFISKDLLQVIRNDDNDEKYPNYGFSAEELALLIEDKKKKRPSFNGVVIVGHFAKWISQLQKERINRIGNFPRRLQAVYKRADRTEDNEDYNHWSAIDILLTEQMMKVFYFDSAGDLSNLTNIIRAVKTQSNTEITICDDVKEIINDEIKYHAIQKDGESCSIFALDFIFQMSKMPDLHDKLASIRIWNEEEGYYEVDPRKLPLVLIRNAQSNTFIQQCMNENKNALNLPINKKNQTLSDYLKTHGVFYAPAKKNVNAGIQRVFLTFSKRITRERNIMVSDSETVSPHPLAEISF